MNTNLNEFTAFANNKYGRSFPNIWKHVAYNALRQKFPVGRYAVVADRGVGKSMFLATITDYLRDLGAPGVLMAPMHVHFDKILSRYSSNQDLKTIRGDFRGFAQRDLNKSLTFLEQFDPNSPHYFYMDEADSLSKEKLLMVEDWAWGRPGLRILLVFSEYERFENIQDKPEWTTSRVPVRFLPNATGEIVYNQASRQDTYLTNLGPYPRKDPNTPGAIYF